MTIELDDLDKDFLARSHTPDEWRRELQDALERCAIYAARIDRLEAEVAQLRGITAGCGYPACLEDNRCARMWAGECSGPRA
jgi:hypothetical protein